MAYIKKINGYVIKDAEAHSRLDTVEAKLVEGVGKIDNVQINGTNQAIDSNKAVNIQADGTYSSSNKLATVSTVTSKVDAAVKGIMGDGVSTAYDTFKEMQTYIETHGNEAASMAGSIAQNTTDIDNLEADIADLALVESVANEEMTLSVGSGTAASTKLYRHCISLYNSSSQVEYAKAEIISTDPDAYTLTTLAEFLSENGALATNGDSIGTHAFPVIPATGVVTYSSQVCFVDGLLCYSDSVVGEVRSLTDLSVKGRVAFTLIKDNVTAIN